MSIKSIVDAISEFEDGRYEDAMKRLTPHATADIRAEMTLGIISFWAGDEETGFQHIENGKDFASY